VRRHPVAGRLPQLGQRATSPAVIVSTETDAIAPAASRQRQIFT
jgi:hypothetical protein